MADGMPMKRRDFLKAGGAAAGSVIAFDSARVAAAALQPSITALTSMRSRATPISVAERRARIEKAQRLMKEHAIDAMMLTGGTSLVYFTGVRWGTSERLFGVVIPMNGTAFCVCPAFEEDRANEQLKPGPLAGAPVRTWQEDESPFQRVAQGLADLGIKSGHVGVEETTKFVFADGIAAAAPALRVVSATPVTAGCRMFKDAHEIALMKLASEATLALACRSANSRRCLTARLRPRSFAKARCCSSTAGAAWRATSQTSAARSCSARRPTR
jgi:Xaa-Pro dipeptidase